MFKTLTVTGEPVQASRPRADTKIDATDFSFAMPGRFRPGARTIEASNGGAQPHEIYIGKLKPGVTRSQVEADLRSEASGHESRSAELVDDAGGIFPIAAGQAMYFNVDLKPGDYFFGCFFRDPKTGRAHAWDGMYSFAKVVRPTLPPGTGGMPAAVGAYSFMEL
jgi:hypothetical protein